MPETRYHLVLRGDTILKDFIPEHLDIIIVTRRYNFVHNETLYIISDATQNPLGVLRWLQEWFMQSHSELLLFLTE